MNLITYQTVQHLIALCHDKEVNKQQERLDLGVVKVKPVFSPPVLTPRLDEP